MGRSSASDLTGLLSPSPRPALEVEEKRAAQSLWALRHEQVAGAGLEHDIGAAPGLIVDQPPLVPDADIVGGDQHIAGTQHERLAVAGGEFQRARERDHVLRLGRVMPIERGVRRGFLEMDRHHVGAVVLGNRPLQHVGGVVRAGIKLERMQHERPHESAANQRASSRANSPLACKAVSAWLTASHKATFSLAKAMPSRSRVGTSKATASFARSLTSHEITGKSLTTRPMRPASRSSNAAVMP